MWMAGWKTVRVKLAQFFFLPMYALEEYLRVEFRYGQMTAFLKHFFPDSIFRVPDFAYPLTSPSSLAGLLTSMINAFVWASLIFGTYRLLTWLIKHILRSYRHAKDGNASQTAALLPAEEVLRRLGKLVNRISLALAILIFSFVGLLRGTDLRRYHHCLSVFEQVDPGASHASLRRAAWDARPDLHEMVREEGLLDENRNGIPDDEEGARKLEFGCFQRYGSHTVFYEFTLEDGVVTYRWRKNCESHGDVISCYG